MADVTVVEPSTHRASPTGVVTDGGGGVDDHQPEVAAEADPSTTGARPKAPLGAGGHVARVALIVVAAVAFSIALQLVVLSGLQHRAAQQKAFDQFRKELAEGTAPLGQTDSSGRALALGTPVAMVDIGTIHVHEVVGEGTTAGVLMQGPGHRRDTPLPGQAGASVIMGRAASYGGPFRGLSRMKVGSKFTVTTGQGVSTFKVIDLRRAGDRTPPALAAGKGRLVLVTATGAPFMPSGVLRVDADLVTPTFGAKALVIPPNGIPAAEQAMGAAGGPPWALALWLEALVLVAVGVVWSWTRWGHHQTWIVFVPLTVVVGFLTADQVIRLLPNLM